MPFRFEPFRDLPDVLLIRPQRFEDERGWFAETFKGSEFAEHGIPGQIPYAAQSKSLGRGILRGLHYQLQAAAQGKLVACPRGEVYDVAVDLRKGSPTYGRWAATRLSEANGHLLWVPPGFAHGFQTLAEETEIHYLMSAEYSPAHYRAVRWNDPALGIDWPVPGPVLSEKDANAPPLSAAENDFTYGG